MSLPDRTELCRRFEEQLQRSRRRGAPAHPLGRDADARPAVLVLALGDEGSLEGEGDDVRAAAMQELGRRVDHLVRSGDLLARVGPERLAFATASLSPAVAGALVERLTAAVAMPLDLGDRTVSLAVTVGLGFAAPGDDAAAVLDRAEADVAHRRAQG